MHEAALLLLLGAGLQGRISGKGPPEATEAAQASLRAGVDRGLDATGYELLNGANGPDLGFYPDWVLAEVRKKWYPLIPQAEQLAGWKPGSVAVDVTIEKDGRLGKTGVTRSSQEKALDDAALNAIKAAAPFRPLPAKYAQRSLHLRYHFAYQEKADPDRPACRERRRRMRPTLGRKPPRALSQPGPEYSEEARRAKYQGMVLVGATVQPDGRVSNLCVEQSLGHGLDEKAIAAVRTWTFQPAAIHDQPVPDDISVEVTFRLY